MSRAETCDEPLLSTWVERPLMAVLVVVPLLLAGVLLRRAELRARGDLPPVG